MAIINASNSQAFQQWFDFYTDKFTRISDSALRGYWYMYGRDSEADAASISARDAAAYAAVNAAIAERDIQP
jgi:hypothetical protein